MNFQIEAIRKAIILKFFKGIFSSEYQCQILTNKQQSEMYYIIYSSYAVNEFDDNRLKELLVQALEKNETLGITGMLFYFNGQFIQLIEGAETAVRQLANEIAIDPRHKHFMILKEGNAEERFFAEWSMGMKSVDPSNFEDVKSFKELNQPNGAHVGSILYLLKLSVS